MIAGWPTPQPAPAPMTPSDEQGATASGEAAHPGR